MKHFLHLMSNFKSHLNIAIWIVFAFFLIQLTSCEEKEDPLPEGFERVAGFQLSAFDSIFVVWPGDQELNLTPKFSAAFGEEVILPTLPSMQFYIDGKRASNPPRIPTDKVREFEIYATIGKLRSKILKIKVIDVDPKTYVSGFKASMGDSTKAPYAISGRSLIDFKASILDFKGREFSDENKPAYKFYFDGVLLENHHRVPILRSGEIPFWIEVGGKKSNVGILYSRELPDLSKKYSLPIIFHIIHSGQAVGTSENPSKERITQLLNQTNDWMMGRTKSESRKGHNQVDPNIEFFPASVGPDGKALEEPGIHRIFSEKRSWVGDLSIKNFLFDQMWNPEEYINVFIVDANKAGGFAFYPPRTPPPLTQAYGVVIGKALLSPILIHELGHFLGLPHTFSVGENCADNDGFLDTESYNDDNKKVNFNFKTNCEGEFFFATNIMDYWPSVWNSFSLEQVVKVRSTLEGGDFLPESSSPDLRINPQPWTRGVFNKTIEPIN